MRRVGASGGTCSNSEARAVGHRSSAGDCPLIPLHHVDERIGERGHLVELGATAGSYEKRVVNGSAGAAFDLGGNDAGIYAYVEYENSESYYRGIEPERLLVQSALTLADGEKWSLEAGGAYYSSDGYKQTLGWNRVTQDLIDNGVYLTGLDTDLRDLNNDGKLTPDEVDAAVGSFFGTSNIRQFVDFGVVPNVAFALDSGVGTARLDPRTVFVSDRDIADSSTGTAYADFTVDAGADQTLRFGAFYDSLDGRLYQSYGFAAEYLATSSSCARVMNFRSRWRASTSIITSASRGVAMRTRHARRFYPATSSSTGAI